MKRFLKAFSLIAVVAFFASCKKDDDVSLPPPRDFTEQNKADTDSIVKFLKTHTVLLDEITYDATFPVLAEGQTSIWDDARKRSTTVRRNGINYTVYYLNFRQGVGDAPSGVDNITVNYRGTLLNGTQFDYRPVIGEEIDLNKVVAKGWQDILPLFNGGTYIGGTDGNPATFADFGAGAMFLPSGLAYFNASPKSSVPAYSCMVFTFQLFDVTYTDIDGDKILNKDEFDWKVKTDPVTGKEIINPETGEKEWEKIPVVFSDTDGDGIPNYADADDDGDGSLTKDEIRQVINGLPSPTLYYTYDEMFDENGNIKMKANGYEIDFGCTNSTRPYKNVPKYMDNTCRGGI